MQSQDTREKHVKWRGTLAHVSGKASQMQGGAQRMSYTMTKVKYFISGNLRFKWADASVSLLGM